VFEQEAGALVDLTRGEEAPGALQVQPTTAEFGLEADGLTQTIHLFLGEHGGATWDIEWFKTAD
jgi:hypothetical protein